MRGMLLKGGGWGERRGRGDGCGYGIYVGGGVGGVLGIGV